MTPAAPSATAAATAAKLTTDQRIALRALADANGGVGERDSDLEEVRAIAAELAGAPFGRQRLRRALFELGASSVRYGGVAARVQPVSPGRPLVESRGGHGGASARRHRLTPFAGDVIAAATQAQEVNPS